MDEKSSIDRELYAIFVPNSPQPTVFRELKEVRKFLDSPLGKKEGTRFKKCADVDELKIFIAAETKKEEESPKQSVTPSTSAEPSSPYRSLPTARFTEFRRAIEQRNDDKFEALIKESPRFFLNTNTDSPAIVQEGYRFNTLHIACRTSNVAVVKRCFELARDLEWLTHVYGTDRCVEERSEFLVDSLLNTPDLIENNTPLHYACKFGQPEIVRLLLSFPTLKRYPKNKYNEKPMDMLCRGFKGSPEEKERLTAEITAIFRRGLSPGRRTPARVMGAAGDATPSSPLSHLTAGDALPTTPRSSTSAAANAGGLRQSAAVDVKTMAVVEVEGAKSSTNVTSHARRIVGAFLARAAAITTTPTKSTAKFTEQTPSPMTREVMKMTDELRDKLLLQTPPAAPTSTPTSTTEDDDVKEYESGEEGESDDSAYEDASELPLRLPFEMNAGLNDEAAWETDGSDGEKQRNRPTLSAEPPQRYCNIL